MLKRVLISVLAMGLLATAAEDKAAKGKMTKPSLADGKKTYQTFCVACHGEKGKGDGAAAAALNPKPRNFGDSAYMSKQTTEKLYDVIAEGGAKMGLSPLMASWKKTLKPQQIDDVLAYVLAFSEDSATAVSRVMERGKGKEKMEKMEKSAK